MHMIELSVHITLPLQVAAYNLHITRLLYGLYNGYIHHRLE